jgi:hypothetical protein
MIKDCANVYPAHQLLHIHQKSLNIKLSKGKSKVESSWLATNYYGSLNGMSTQGIHNVPVAKLLVVSDLATK